MKRILKGFLFVALAIITTIMVFAGINYHSDIPLKVLKRHYMHPEAKELFLDGMSVHYRVQGSGSPLLLLHGTASSLHTWDDWIEPLEDHFQIIRMDLPGFGLTGPHPERDYSMEMYVDFVDQFCEKLGLDSLYVAGNSLGGNIAWEFALKHPLKVRKLVLLDATGYPRKQATTPLAFRMARTPVLNNIMKKITPKRLVEKSIYDVYGQDDRIESSIIDRHFELLLRPGNRAAFIDRIQTHKDDRSKYISTISTPTLILWGELDEWVPVEHAKYFHRDLKLSELTIYPDAGHVPMEEIPGRTARDTKSFLLKDQLGNGVITNQ